LAKYLVTGAAGFIGRSIAAALVERGEVVRGIDSLITGKRANLAGLEAMEFIEGDLADPATCARACAGVEVIFHEAALASVPRSVADPVATHVNCVNATLNVLVAARAAGVRRVVYAGSSSAYGDTPTLPKACWPSSAARCWPENSLRSTVTASRAAILPISTTWSRPTCWPLRHRAKRYRDRP
jgi:nucleoside-diphosphate-sugar epimerase